MGLPKPLRWLVINNSLIFVVLVYIGIYVNLYIWEIERQISDVAWFNLIMLLSWSISFYFGAGLMMKYSLRTLTVLAAGFGGTAFLALTFLKLDDQMAWIAAVAVPVGAMWGCYVSAQNLSVSLVGAGEQFLRYFGIMGVLCQLISVSVPLLSAQVILRFEYTGSFILMFLFIAIILSLSGRLPKISLKEAAETAGEDGLLAHMRWRRAFAKQGTKWVVLSSLATGCFLQFQILFVLLFTFSITKDKMLIALLNTAYALSSVLALYLYRKIRISDHAWLYFGVICTASGFFMIFFPSVPVLIASNVLTTIGMFYVGILWNSQIFELVQDYSPLQKAGFFIWREVLINFTRCVMALFMMFIHDFSNVLFYGVVCLALAGLASIPMLQYKAMQGNLPEPANPSRR